MYSAKRLVDKAEPLIKNVELYLNYNSKHVKTATSLAQDMVQAMSALHEAFN